MSIYLISEPRSIPTMAWNLWKYAIGAAAFLCLLFPAASYAGNISFPIDTPLVMSGTGINLTIKAGSQANTLTVSPNTFSVTVAAGEQFLLRYPGPNSGTLANDSGGAVPPCDYVAVGGHNDATINGPVTVTFTPNTLPSCVTTAAAASGGPSAITYNPNKESRLTILKPNGAEAFKIGDQTLIEWFNYGTMLYTVRITLSTDGGLTFPTIIADNWPNRGNYYWKIPNFPTEKAMIKVEGKTFSNYIAASDVSNANFSIVSEEKPPLPEEEIKKPAEEEPKEKPKPVEPLPIPQEEKPAIEESKIAVQFVNLPTMRVFNPGDIVPTNYRLTNLSPSAQTISLLREITDTNELIMFISNGSRTLQPFASIDVAAEYMVPKNFKEGAYKVSIKTFINGKASAQDSFSFNIEIPKKIDIAFTKKLSGRILLQVEGRGEAWYVYPKDQKRYYLGTASDMLTVMKKLGLGIRNADIIKIPVANGNGNNKNGLSRLDGYILIQVEDKGKAWYVNPVNHKRYSLGNAQTALGIVRTLGLGVSNQNINKIPVGR